jgi:site-specific recombinase XerD
VHGLHQFAAERVDIESFRGEMEAAGRARATIACRLCTIAGFYRHAVEEVLEHSPAAHVRRPRLNYGPTPPPWTATSSASYWSRPASAPPKSAR